jgi:hypothetical protein
VAALPLKRIPLDTVLMSLNQQAEQKPELVLHNKPPKIFFSVRSLVFCSQPEWPLEIYASSNSVPPGLVVAAEVVRDVSNAGKLAYR